MQHQHPEEKNCCGAGGAAEQKRRDHMRHDLVALWFVTLFWSSRLTQHVPQSNKAQKPEEKNCRPGYVHKMKNDVDEC